MMFSVLLLITLIVEFCFVDTIASTLQNAPLALYATHESQLHRIVSDIKERPEGKKITLRRRPEQSHCPRPHAYKSNAIQLDISEFDKLLNVEYLHENKDLTILIPDELKSRANNEEIFAVADVQALMSMEQLVDALLPLGLMPAVVPEFKGITVGGSLQGLAAESTSFKYGFVHDAIIGFEAVLTNGTVLWCSPQCNSELFYSLPGSFGSLAICTRVKILCVKADPYVTVVCTEHTSQSDCVDYMSKIQNSAISDGKKLQNSLQNGDITSSGSVNFVEGIALRKDQVVTITATFLSKADVDSLDKKRKKELQYCNGIGNKWFFNQVRDSVRKASNALKKIKNNDKNNGYYRKNKEVGQDSEHGGVVSSENIVVGKFILPLKDYLFRHDQGSFWMASYRIPQIIGRFMGPLLDSTNMFRLATALPWAFPKNTIVLQDFILPNSNVKDFFTSMEDQLDVWPVWLLPMRNIPSEGSLFASPKGLGDQHLCNVGAYGIPRKKYDFIQANKKLEELLYEFNGRKVYYSHAFYARDFFYDILYDGLKYFQLRNRYCHDEALPEIFDKIITHNGKL